MKLSSIFTVNSIHNYDLCGKSITTQQEFKRYTLEQLGFFSNQHQNIHLLCIINLQETENKLTSNSKVPYAAINNFRRLIIKLNALCSQAISLLNSKLLNSSFIIMRFDLESTRYLLSSSAMYRRKKDEDEYEYVN